jgi:hypothetical protein
MTNGNGITKTAADVEGLWNIRIQKQNKWRRRNSRRKDPRIFKLDLLVVPSVVMFKKQSLCSNWSLNLAGWKWNTDSA